jgi:3D-(3,5/4)-trihydroxycyclohexane-1,2-dione acylhydrolase (decyclizing)
MAAPDREVFVLVGDGSYLMMAQEIVTAVSEGIKLNLVLVQNQGFGSIGSLSESLGSQRFGTRYRYRDRDTGCWTATSSGRPGGQRGQPRRRRDQDPHGQGTSGRAGAVPRVGPDHGHLYRDRPARPVPSSESWWDVPVSQTSALDSTQQARTAYEAAQRDQRMYL